MTKRTRFGLVFEGEAPDFGKDFLTELIVTDAEGCKKDALQFMLFRTSKPRSPSEVSRAVARYNITAERAIRLIEFDNEPQVRACV